MIRDLNAQDSAIFAVACRTRLESGEQLIDMRLVEAAARDLGFNNNDLRGTIAELAQKGYIQRPGARGGLLPVSIQPTLLGLIAYVESCERSRYLAARAETIDAIISGKASEMPELISVSSDPAPGLLDLIIERLGEEGRLDVINSFGGPKRWTARPNLRRE